MVRPRRTLSRLFHNTYCTIAATQRTPKSLTLQVIIATLKLNWRAGLFCGVPAASLLVAGVSCVVRRCGSAALAAFVCWMLLTAAASASCGDWLKHSDEFTTPSQQTKKGTSVAPAGIADPSPAAPCNGPFCGRIPEQPPAPGPADISVAPAKSALQIGLITLAECTRQSPITGEADAKGAKGFPALVYHPPRG